MSRRKTKRKHSVVEVVGFLAMGIVVLGIIWLVVTQPQNPPNSNQTTATLALAPDFALTDVDGSTFRLSDQQGKVVVLEFMRTTCSACVSEAPTLADLRTKFLLDNVVMVTVTVDPAGDTDVVFRNFRNQNMMGWIAARDTARVYQKYSVQATPTIFIIDKDGHIRYQHVGVTESSVLISEIGSLA